MRTNSSSASSCATRWVPHKAFLIIQYGKALVHQSAGLQPLQPCRAVQYVAACSLPRRGRNSRPMETALRKFSAATATGFASDLFQCPVKSPCLMILATAAGVGVCEGAHRGAAAGAARNLRQHCLRAHQRDEVSAQLFRQGPAGEAFLPVPRPALQGEKRIKTTPWNTVLVFEACSESV